jgi:hypothetical protein
MDQLPRRLSKPGPLIEYIAELQRVGLNGKADIVIRAVQDTLRTPSGAIFMELLDKSILECSIDISADPRALDANNAQSFIALDLRRILSDEFDATTKSTQNDTRSARRSGGRGG